MKILLKLSHLGILGPYIEICNRVWHLDFRLGARKGFLIKINGPPGT